MVEGELRDRRHRALPVYAAAGGMVVPALLFVAFNVGRPEIRGWGIPMATDIALAVGVIAIVGSRVRPALKLFLLALAIVDDIGAILVIGLVYAGNLQWGGNLELARAVAEEAVASRLRSYAASEDEFLGMCGAIGLGRLFAEGDVDALDELHRLASDRRWRVREGVAMALQRLGDVDRRRTRIVAG